MGKSRIGKHSKKEADIKEGDTVVVSKQFLNSFDSHCENENDIPEHNHGVVTRVIKPNDMYNGKNRHPSPHTLMGMYDYVTFKMPNDREISLFSVDLRKLY